MLTHTHKELTINMNEESKKLLDSILFLQSVASIRGVKTEDRLIAFAEDMLANTWEYVRARFAQNQIARKG